MRSPVLLKGVLRRNPHSHVQCHPEPALRNLGEGGETRCVFYRVDEGSRGYGFVLNGTVVFLTSHNREILHFATLRSG